MDKELSERYYFNPADYDENGRRLADGKTFRNVVKDFERSFHKVHTTDYALNMYANSQTMRILALSNNAEPFMIYGMDLHLGHVFDPEGDPYINKSIDEYSENVLVYGIDSAYMTDFDKYGNPILTEDSEVFPLTLLVDNTMRDGELRLSTPTIDGDESEPVTNDVPQKEYV
ncbi:MAG: hypothetical protein J6U03_00935 [Muribaculaceae bacterium]|nr:hypothetical protein [Muribaculaceae bacterium]